MMRKVIYTIGFMMFLSGPLAPLMIHAQETATDGEEVGCDFAADPTCVVNDRLKKASGGEDGPSLDWGQTFGDTDPKEVGQDLYLTVYSKSQSSTLETAIKETAAQYGLPPERMTLILGGDISPILERSPLMRIDDAIKIYNQMVANYNDRKNSADLQAAIKAKVEPNEIFADGDLDNSGFDLINDLNNIEIILFQKNDLVTFGGSYDPGSNDEDTGSASQPSTGTGNGQPGDLPIDVNGNASGNGSGNNNSGTNNPPVKSPFDTNDEDKSKGLLGGINPNQCFTDSKVDDALEKFSKDAANNKKLQHNDDASNSSTTNSGSGTGANSGSAGSNVNVPIPIDSTSTAAAPQLAAAPAADYSTPTLCPDGEIFCLTIDFIKTTATPSFSSTDNCIACHVQYINDGLKKTISHSLIPAKATGNLGENGLCKNAAGTALGSVGMNVSINIVPIITPTKSDLVTLGNISDEWAKYAAQNGAWNYGEKERRRLEALKNNTPINTSPIASNLEREILVSISTAADNTSQGNVLAKAVSADATAKATANEAIIVLEVSKDAQGQIDTFKALDDEMKTMNKYFDGFQKSFRTLLEDVPGLASTKACVKLNAKQVCT